MMMNALLKFEEIVKGGIAPFVGREGEWVDPISRLPSLEFSPTPGGNTANYDTADIAAKYSDTDASMGGRSNNSDNDNPRHNVPNYRSQRRHLYPR
ncbi:hypothetical protein PC129_g20341 [Phytophthora cactorum]|uniref:Uncharacterized protein n=1 Tax=Phytophthora cactorum TaxID=29920 RepID=A0A329SHU2_9STRA|nr:hypothetical protein Pcac1_g24589 [Phytophthora cactorum]KAG2798877.1 hypothetical protein PC112_g21164 [Phytophthora cactorum]KAG2798951.1 hypothetical protein PC111_g20631 [Phytophthora cactorum]KAG2903144.1 hypothetical protein PC114_g12387 [Phytophthora cactorum]KAG2973561.1 hypothetical protein PC119_g22888 [Phytophthora cactorum]